MEGKNKHVAQECEDLKAKLDRSNNDIYSHLVDDYAHLSADYGHLIDDYDHLEIYKDLRDIYQELLEKVYDFINEYEYYVGKCKRLLFEEEVKQLKRDIDNYQHEIDEFWKAQRAGDDKKLDELWKARFEGVDTEF